MLSRCANSQCARPFLRLGQGRLFLVESESVAKVKDLTSVRSPYLRKPARRIERYWLCDRCAESWTLVPDQQTGVALIPLRTTVLSSELRIS